MKRRYLRISLRVLMLLAILVALTSWYVVRVEKQRKAVEWLYQVDGLGSRACYDYEIVNQNGSEVRAQDQKPVTPSWLIDWLGIDCFCTVVHANVNLDEVTSIKPIGSLTNITNLQLEGMAISDFGPLSSLANLKDLHLYRTNLRDLTPLSTLYRLEVLRIKGTGVSDLTPLKSLPKLKCLFASHTKIVDLAPIANSKDLAPIANSKELIQLDIEGTSVTSLAPIADLKGLLSVNIQNTLISDVSPLFNHEDLKVICLGNTRVPEAQIAQLIQMLPECDVFTEQADY